MTIPSNTGAGIPGLAKAVLQQLNMHGHALQYSVVRAVEAANRANLSSWSVEVAEHPVAINRHETRIDFVLKHRHHPIFMTVECKRVSPKYSSWVFLKAPFVRRDHESAKLVVERAEYGPHSQFIRS